MIDFPFILNSLLLGLGLTMDAFSVSLANGLNEQNMKKGKAFGVVGTFAFFQGLMPMIGWICVHTILQYFTAFNKFVPIIALGLLTFIGVKMIIDGAKNKEEEQTTKVGFWGLILQGIATSIDALSVGFTIAEYDVWSALVAVVIIALVTFVACVIGVFLGKKFGTKLANKASVFGGAILIFIGLEIFVTGIF